MVDETTLGAQMFFRAQGFRAVKVVRDYYDDGRAAYIMEYQFEEGA